MTKLFYTDPLKAAFMVREYGVNCESKNGVQALIFDNAIVQDWPAILPYYIHPDSLSIFEPKAGDIFTYVECDSDNWPETHRYIDGTNENWVKSANCVQIIQRDGKAFFMPEREK